MELDGLDHGTYYFFRFQARQAPALEPLMVAGGEYFACPWTMSAVAVVVLGLLLFQGRKGTALIAAGVLAVAAAILAGLPLVLWRRRQEDAQNYLTHMTSSYPSRGVFLVMLVGILLGLALE